MKKILIITYYWFPAGGPGVQRWLKFTKYLPEFGWEPIIYTPSNPNYPIIDESLKNSINPSTKIIKKPIWEPYKLAEIFNKKNKKFKGGQFDIGKKQDWKSKLSMWIRGNFFIPDARKFWVAPSAKFLEKYINENNIDVLVTTGPPHSMHLIGLELKKRKPELFWVADFRDPWTQISYYKHLKLTPWADKKHKFLEKNVFQTANITLATSPKDTENFQKLGANSHCITNGFDTENLSPNKNKNTGFSISYIGVLEQLRNPQNLWKAIGELVQENENFSSNFTLQFAGRVDEHILAEIQKIIPPKNLQILGYLNHSEAYKIMANSNMLIITNFPNEESSGIIPGKLFEYLSTGNTIISLGSKPSSVQDIITETETGKHFSYDEKNEIKTFIIEEFSKYKTKDYKKELSEKIKNYSRRNLTKKLANLLNEHTSTRQLR